MLKKSLSILFLGLITLIFVSNPCYSADNAKDSANLSKVSEAFGNFIGKTLSNPNSGIRFDIESVIKGIREGTAGKPSPLSEQEYEKAIAELQENAFKELSEANLKAANQYMVDNAKEKNLVVIEPNKLQYVILKEGTGPLVNEHASPLINYTGKFIDGTVFGSSEETGPISISLDRTIPGFGKGLVGMKQGEKRRLFIHPDLAYGTKGDLPPNALLIFDVEVVNASTPNEELPSIAHPEGTKGSHDANSSDHLNGSSDLDDEDSDNQDKKDSH